MSFGFSVSDIIISYQLAFQIYDRCFTKAQGAGKSISYCCSPLLLRGAYGFTVCHPPRLLAVAYFRSTYPIGCSFTDTRHNFRPIDVKYLQFGRDISSLGFSLQQLELIIKNAQKQSPEKPWRREADSSTATILNTLSEVTGDFKRTLHDCERLLSDNSKFQRSATSFVDNVVWHSSTERVVNHLRQRVNFHLTKINFIARPFELQLLLGIHRELQQVKKDVAALKGVLIPDTAQSIHPASPKSHDGRFHIHPDLAKRFERALACKPDSGQGHDHVPLKEGFDAIAFHLASSTVKFKPSPGPGQNIPEETQFVNLLKSGWIMEKLKGSDYLQSAGPESLWLDYMRELENEISDQLSRLDTGELEPPTPDVILRLPDNCFSIWGYEDSLPRPAVLAEQRPLEEKILELALPSLYDNRRSTLTIFRKSDVAFRMVSTTKDEQNKDFHSEESMDVNMNLNRFIPAFATPHDGEAVNNNVLLCNSQGQDLKWYHFQDSSAVAEFQRALMGYRVSNDMSNISWHIEFSKFNKKAISGKARLQFWHLKPLPNLLSSVDATTSEGSDSSAGASPQSPSGSANLRRFWTSSTLALSGSSIAAPVTGSRGDGIALTRPELPVLVIFTRCERKYTFFHIPSTFHGRSTTSSVPITNWNQWIAACQPSHKRVCIARIRTRLAQESSYKAALRNGTSGDFPHSWKMNRVWTVGISHALDIRSTRPSKTWSNSQRSSI